MEKLFVSLAVALTMVMAMATATPAMAVEDSLQAEVDINVIINFTVEDKGDTGLRFGSLNPGSSDNPELAQNGTGAAALLLGAETNVDCDVNTKASDFTSGSDILLIGNARWDTDNNVSGATAMTSEYTRITTLSGGSAQDVWHWLSIPSDQAPGSYTTHFYYQAVEVTS